MKFSGAEVINISPWCIKSICQILVYSG
jgi:transposase